MNPKLPYHDLLALMAMYLTRTNRILSGRPTTCVLDKKSSKTDPPAYTDGVDVFFNVESAPNVATRDGRAVFFGLNDHELAHLLFTPTDSSFTRRISSYKTAFNILEDQRIESLIAHLYPSMAAFLTASYAKYCMTPHKDLWAFTYGRLYLPPKVRRWALKRKSGYPADVLTRGKEVIRQYCSLDIQNTSNYVKGAELIKEFHQILGLRGNQEHPWDTCASKMKPTNYGKERSEEQKKSTGEALASNAEKFETEEGEGTSGKDGEGGKDKDSARGNNESGQEENSESAGGSTAGRGRGAENGPVTYAEAVEAVNEAAHTEEANRVIRQFEKFINGDTPIYSAPMENSYMTPVMAWARSLVSRSVQIIKRVEDEVEPGWERMKTSGRLDAVRAARLGVFEPEVFNQWNPGADPATSFEICILLDRSGSMSGSTDSLSQAVWAMKRMGDLIGASTSAWAYDAYASVIYKNTDRADPDLAPEISPRGGTEPSPALRDAYLTLTRSKKKRKLLIVMTDGQWSLPLMRKEWGSDWFKSNDETIEGLGKNGVMTVVVLYGTYVRSVFRGVDTHCARYAKHITDLGQEMPVVMRDMVNQMMKEKQR